MISKASPHLRLLGSGHILGMFCASFPPKRSGSQEAKLLTWKKTMSCGRELALEMGAGVSVSTTGEAAMSPFMSSHPGQRTSWILGSACPLCTGADSRALGQEQRRGPAKRQGAGGRGPQPCSHWLHSLASVSSPEKWAHAFTAESCQEDVQTPRGALSWAGASPLHSTTSLLITLPI